MQKIDKITLKDMVFSASVGVSEWEREVPTSLQVDVEVETELHKACITDNLHDTIDYSEMYDIVGKSVTSRHHNLLESLAQEVADGILSRCKCQAVTVKIRKLNPPVKGVCAFAEVEIRRQKK